MTEAVFSSDAPRVSSVDFSIGVGAVVPSHVRLMPVPDTLVEIYREWRGDEVVVVRDEIIIVDHTRKIVAVIPAGRHHAWTRSSMSSATVVDLSPAEIREVQTVLIEKGFLHGQTDGIWAPDTREALITFQRREGLQVTGHIGRRTVGRSARPRPPGKPAPPRGQNDRASSKSPRATSGQVSPSPNETPSKGDENRSITPKATSQPSRRDTTGQGSPHA